MLSAEDDAVTRASRDSTDSTDTLALALNVEAASGSGGVGRRDTLESNFSVLSSPGVKSQEEVTMKTLLHEGNAAGALAVLEHSEAAVNARMINMAFSAKVAVGNSIDSAAVDMLRLCETHNVEPSRAMHNNVLAALSRRGPPEAVLSWLARMRASAVKLDRVGAWPLPRLRRCPAAAAATAACPPVPRLTFFSAPARSQRATST